MNRLVLAFASLMLVPALVGCGAGQGVADTGSGMKIEARQDVRVSEEPLGDVGIGMVGAGDVATALCYVPKNAENRRALFDVGQDILSSKLPACTDG